MAKPSGQRAYTLIEFIVMVVIVGLVVAITVSRLMNRQDKIKVDAAKNNVSAIITALKEFEKYYV